MGVRYYYDNAAVQRAAESSWARLHALASDPRTPALAQQVSAYRETYPLMKAGEVLPLAQSGQPPSSTLARYAANRSAVNRKKSLGYWDTLRGGPLGPLAVGSRAIGDLGGLGLGILKPTVRYGTGTLQGLYDVATGSFRSGITALPGHTGEIAGGAAAGAALGTIVPGVGNVVGAVVGGAVGGILGALAPEVEGTPQNPLLQTPLGQHFFKGASIGEGYFAGGEAAKKAHATAKAAANIDGFTITPGRMLASGVTEPGTTPFNLFSGVADASLALSKLDPSSAILGATSKARLARRSFASMADKTVERTAAGLVEGARKDIMPEVAREWMNTRGAKTIEAIAGETDFETLRRSFRGLDTGTVLDLQKADSTEAVRSILESKLGVELQFTPSIKKVRTSRMAQNMPAGHLDFNDADLAVEEFDRLQRNVKLPKEKVSENNQRMAEALRRTGENPYGDKQTARRLVYDTLISPDSGVLAGADPTLAQRFTHRLFARDQEMLDYFRRSQVLQTGSQGVVLGGADHALALPGLLVEELDDVLRISRGSIRDMRRASSNLSGLMSSKSWETFVAGGDAMMSAWRPLALLRGAWTVRVVGEEQVRMAAAGLNSVFAHPMSFFTLALSDDGRIARALERFGAPGKAVAGQLGRARTGLVGEFDSAPVEAQAALRGEINEHLEAMGRRQQARGWAQMEDTNPRQSRFVLEQNQVRYTRYADGTHDAGYVESWAEQLEILSRDPVARRLANGGLLADDVPETRAGLEGVRQWFEAGEGNEIRRYLSEEPGGAALLSPEGVDGYLSNTQAQVQRMAGAVDQTAPDAVILSAIATGELDGVAIRLPNGTLNKEFVAKLKDHAARGPEGVTGAGLARKGFKETRDAATEWLFEHFMGIPSAKMSRSTTFRQTYWNRTEDLIYSATKEDQVRIIAQAEAAKLSSEQIGRLRARAAKGYGSHTLTEVDVLAKRQALDFTKQLLYDTAEKGQLSDALRLVFPFAEAQKEVMTRWAKLGTENLPVARRAQQIVQGAEGAGFFYKDEQTGEEMFAYPGGELLTEKLFGLPIKLGGQAASLSLFGSGVMPGVGPAIQVPAGWLLAGRPEFDELRSFISPFGTQEEPESAKGVAGDVVGAFIPAWANKLITGGIASKDDRAFSNAVMDVWAAGVSSGKWSTETEEDVQNGLQAARNRARGLFFLRGLASAGGAPTAVTPEYMAQDASGRWHMADILRQDYRAMMDKDPQGANRTFLEKYGDNAFAYMQSRTETLTSAPTGVEAADWVRANQELVSKYPKVYGFFAPQGGNLDYQQYLRQIATGERITLTEDQFASKAQDRVGQMIYYNLKDKFGPYPSAPQQAFLSQARQLIRESLPGFDEHLPLPERYKPAELIEGLQEAVADPALGETDVGQAISLYLKARDILNLKAQSLGGGVKTFNRSKAAAPLRAWMRDFASQITTAVPDFGLVYQRVLDKEMLDDGDDTAEAPLAS